MPPSRPWVGLIVMLSLAALAGLAWQVLPGGGPAPAATAAAGTLRLTATPTPQGQVKLSWQLTGAQLRGPIRIQRSVNPDGLTAEDPDRYPVARWDVPARAAGTWVDAAPASGVTYHYHVQAAGLTSPAVAVRMPERPLPPLRAPALRIDKRAYVLTVLDGHQVAKRYPIALGGSPTTRKRIFDNASTPEGVYHIVGVQPRATYHRAFDLSYPNALDQVRYRLARGTRADYPLIGGEIQIHGKGIDTNWTFGCIALRDADMDELFTRPALKAGVEVRLWGGELTEAEVAAMAEAPPPETLARWRKALVAKGHPTDGRWGPGLWEAIGRFQLAQGLPLTCQPDVATAKALF